MVTEIFFSKIHRSPKKNITGVIFMRIGGLKNFDLDSSGDRIIERRRNR